MSGFTHAFRMPEGTAEKIHQDLKDEEKYLWMELYRANVYLQHNVEITDNSKWVMKNNSSSHILEGLYRIIGEHYWLIFYVKKLK